MRDPKTEQFLERGHYQCTYHEAISISDIDFEASRDNPTRLHRALDVDRVTKYGIAMLDDVKFPAIVLLEGFEKYPIATGVHRTAAAIEARLQTIDAYIVAEPDTYRAESLMRQLNTLEGKGMSTRDCMLQAIELHEKYPHISLAQLSKEWHLSKHGLMNLSLEQETMRRARKLGFDLQAYNLSQKSILSLHTIHSDRVFSEAIDYSTRPGVNAADVSDMAKEVRKVRDENSALEIVKTCLELAEQRTQASRARHGRTKPSNASKIFRGVRTLSNQFSKGIPQLHLSTLQPMDRKSLRMLSIELRESLHHLEIEIERIDEIEIGRKAAA